MKRMYVDRKSELSIILRAFESAGFWCYRVRTFCDCPDCDNRRDGLLILDGDRVALEIIRCKGCGKRNR